LCKQSPPRGKFVGKIPNFDDFGGRSHISAPANVKFGMEEPNFPFIPVPNFTFIGVMCRPCGAKNPFLDHLVYKMSACCPAVRPAGNYSEIAE